MASKLKSFLFESELTDRRLRITQHAIILLFCTLPLFFNYPFRINLFLAWEGAYRMSIGQVPFYDFSLPMGFGFWIIPALAFKIFGAGMFTLVIAQVFINLVSCWSFAGICRRLGMSEEKILVSLVIFCISFVFINFWPWYNHSVIVFELAGSYLLIRFCFATTNKQRWWFLVASAFLIVLSFFTKQDGGGFAILIAGTLVMANGVAERAYRWIFIYAAAGLLFMLLFIVPFLNADFAYWFNHGQPPHSARLHSGDLLKDIFEHSEWIKFYMIVTLIIAGRQLRDVKSFLADKQGLLFTLFTLGIQVQAMILQVTSYIPHNANVYFHAISLAYLLHHFSIGFSLRKFAPLAVVLALVMFWWSADYWKYAQRITSKLFPSTVAPRDKSQLSKYTWSLETAAPETRRMDWKLSGFKSFRGVYLPEETIEGIKRLKQLDVIVNTPEGELKVLNMSELTPLATELPYTPLTNQPMWFHKNVAIFDREIAQICNKIVAGEYDLVLFQTIPNLNNFFPDELRKCLQENYQLRDSFLAPRVKENSEIEVYTRVLSE